MCVLLKFAEMLDSVGKFVSFLTIGGLTALAVLLQYYRKRTAAKDGAVNVEVIKTTHFLHVSHTILNVGHSLVSDSLTDLFPELLQGGSGPQKRSIGSEKLGCCSCCTTLYVS